MYLKLWQGGVVQRGLQREREVGDERWVNGSSANDKHLGLVSVTGVERPHKETGEGEAGRERERRLLTGGCVGMENVCSGEPQVYTAYALCYIERW